MGDVEDSFFGGVDDASGGVGCASALVVGIKEDLARSVDEFAETECVGDEFGVEGCVGGAGDGFGQFHEVGGAADLVEYASGAKGFGELDKVAGLVGFVGIEEGLEDRAVGFFVELVG